MTYPVSFLMLGHQARAFSETAKTSLRGVTRMTGPRGLFFAISAALPVSVCAAATLHVPSEYPTIDAGIVAAQVGDTVLVAPGVYTGTGNKSLSFYGKDIVLKSEAGPEQTIIDVEANFRAPGRGILIDGGESEACVLDGFTIQNGFMSTQPDLAPSSDLHDLSAGGFKVNLLSRPTIKNMIVRNCHSQFTGGGVSIEIQSAPTLINVRIIGCSSETQGGGISIESGSYPVVQGCAFTGNRALIGGGMSCDSSPFTGPIPQIIDCTVAGNYARDNGGGIFCAAFSKTTFERMAVDGNCSGVAGGDIWIEPIAEATFQCSVIDSSGVDIDPDGVVDFSKDNVLDVPPGFCDPDTCTASPSTAGDYGVSEDSPCLARNSPCGARIGGIGRGACAPVSPVVETSWGKLKDILGRPGK